MKLSFPIIFVSDMNRSVVFYRDVLGLPLKFESPGWTEFDIDGATLALHPVPDSDDGPGPSGSNEHGAPPIPGAAGQCRPGFTTPELDAFHQRMLDAGVPCVREPTEVYGVRIAQYADLDGLVFGVSEERGG